MGTLKTVDQPQTSAESGAPPLDETLRRVVLYFRVLAYLWMVLLVVVTLVTDEQADPAPIIVALGLASVWTLVTAWAVTRPAVLKSWGFVVADGVVALVVASASFAADSEHLFHGGYPMSWVVVAGYAKGMPGSIGSALILMVHQITLRLVDGDAAAVSVAGDVIFLAFALIIGWVFEALPRNDALRRDAEARYEQEHRERERYEQRAELANQLHDSVLQTLQVIRNDADDPAEVRYLARRQERELRRLIEDFRSPYEHGFKAALLQARDDVEDLFRVEIEAVVRDDRELTPRLDAAVDAAREAMTNAAKHAGVRRFDVYSEIVDGNVAVFVRDRGSGFDPEASGGHGLAHSIIERVELSSGRVAITSAPGRGTEVEIVMPLGAEQ